MRLSHSGKAFHVAFATQAQEAFLEGHVLAFEYFGGVPGRIRYDNLKPAVVRVLKGRDRTSPNGSPRCAATTGSTRSSAARASTAPMRRAVWRARSAASGGATSSRSPRSPRWPQLNELIAAG